jgi:hypothetical protein
MERHDGDERRKQDRRQGERRGDVKPDVVRQEADKTGKEKRQCLRLAYPLAAAPQITNMRLQVVGISAKAVRFFIPDFVSQESVLKEGSKINIAIKFHDGEIIKRGGTILKQERSQEGREHFVCLFERQLPTERIEKEHAYLLKNFPDFCNIIFGS